MLALRQIKNYNTAKCEKTTQTHQNRCGLVLIKSPSVLEQVSYVFQLQKQLFHSFLCLLNTARSLRFLLCCNVTEMLRLASLVP